LIPGQTGPISLSCCIAANRRANMADTEFTSVKAEVPVAKKAEKVVEKAT
jgi:hypothetical protein